MKAITFTPPWGLLAALGEKEYETRGWHTMYRGRLALHHSQRFPMEAVEICYTWPFNVVLAKHGSFPVTSIPLGSIIGVCDLVQMWRSEELVERNALTAQERAFGNYDKRRYGFQLANPVLLKQPIPCKGALMLWDVPPAIEAEINRQLAII